MGTYFQENIRGYCVKSKQRVFNFDEIIFVAGDTVMNLEI